MLVYTKPYTFSFMKIRKWLRKITVFDQFLALLFAEKINELALKLLKKEGQRWRWQPMMGQEVNFLGDLFVVIQIAEVSLRS